MSFSAQCLFDADSQTQMVRKETALIQHNCLTNFIDDVHTFVIPSSTRRYDNELTNKRTNVTTASAVKHFHGNGKNVHSILLVLSAGSEQAERKSNNNNH